MVIQYSTYTIMQMTIHGSRTFCPLYISTWATCLFVSVKVAATADERLVHRTYVFVLARECVRACVYTCESVPLPRTSRDLTLRYTSIKISLRCPGFSSTTVSVEKWAGSERGRE